MLNDRSASGPSALAKCVKLSDERLEDVRERVPDVHFNTGYGRESCVDETKVQFEMVNVFASTVIYEERSSMFGRVNWREENVLGMLKSKTEDVESCGNE